MNCSDVPDDAAPMMAVAPSPSRRGISVSYALLSVSPESPWMRSTVTPLAAALTSEAAYSVPAISGGPRKARLPVTVTGSAVPIL